VTPAVAALEREGVAFRLHEYRDATYGDGDYAAAVARELGVDPARLFKTLVASVDGDLRVFVVPADRQLDVRAAGKRAQMAERAHVERVTGYPAGGISPFGQRRKLPTTLDESALAHETILVSAGRRGLQVELDPRELVRVLGAETRAIAR
jgi:Cys-tRNA(Pro)/Cys-tRNA(Cys) deacylase